MDHLADISPSWLQNGEVEERCTSRYVLFPSQTILLQLQSSYISDKSGEWNFLFLYPKTQPLLTSSQLCTAGTVPMLKKNQPNKQKNKTKPHTTFSACISFPSDFCSWYAIVLCPFSFLIAQSFFSPRKITLPLNFAFLLKSTQVLLHFQSKSSVALCHYSLFSATATSLSYCSYHKTLVL